MSLADQFAPVARLAADGGPIYAETDLTQVVREPYNAITAVLFVVIAVRHLLKARRLGVDTPFIMASGWILLVGGVGGTLYHALRVWRGFLIMDFMPILILILAGSMRLLRERVGSWWRAVAITLSAMAVQLGLVFALGGRPRPTLGYLMLGLLVIVPALWTLVRDRYRHLSLVALAISSFGVALAFRMLDGERLLPMGTHFLWHAFGAVATWAVLEWTLRREVDTTLSAPLSTAVPATS